LLCLREGELIDKIKKMSTDIKLASITLLS
jgi:hypothetical protein